MGKTITLEEVVKGNPYVTFSLTFQGKRYHAKFDRDSKHFYSYLNYNGRAVIMKTKEVSDIIVYSQSQYIGYNVIV